MENAEEKSSNNSALSSYGKAIRTAGPLFTAGIQMAVAIGLMGFVGYALDRHWQTTPWLMVAGIFFGAAAGMYQFIKTATAIDTKKDEERKSA
ncbi:MAG: AtpZ/AtpI family protein [Ignavibacteriae bacterium]|nr:AtpZ/AtpI family protein [Ignavibacteria bacterium]MBI3365376.1 AtpZ/AtpI family protein [Ignavibacteriota bacterium]